MPTSTTDLKFNTGNDRITSNSMISARPTVLVLGGYGFIGRYTVSALRKCRCRIIVGTRGRRVDATGSQFSEQRVVKLHETLDADAWTGILQDVDVVINTVGILRERTNETFEDVHCTSVSALAESCKNRGIPLVHVSALGIDQAVCNRFSLSKRCGEEAIIRSGCKASVVRASVVDAVDGYGSGWFHRIAQWPVYLLPQAATKKLSPIAATDLGAALCQLALQHAMNKNQPYAYPTQSSSKNKLSAAQLLEVGCGESFTLNQYLLRLRKSDTIWGNKPWLTVRVPNTIARGAAILFDYLHLTPYSIGHHELLTFDNEPKHNQLPAILGRSPTRIGIELPGERPMVATS